ncbi:hypothetical protein CEXT_280551 [Caerostris extrusa]|uniref:Uncharacterized protein n=1 Tax=Caerostris extrusa TaxID=172846 RepID=A0AAV4UVB0_CAEEX|nr:hypothetical protein CEXT_280551 [Caerostris extrusa]
MAKLSKVKIKWSFIQKKEFNLPNILHSDKEFEFIMCSREQEKPKWVNLFSVQKDSLGSPHRAAFAPMKKKKDYVNDIFVVFKRIALAHHRAAFTNEEEEDYVNDILVVVFKRIALAHHRAAFAEEDYVNDMLGSPKGCFCTNEEEDYVNGTVVICLVFKRIKKLFLLMKYAAFTAYENQWGLRANDYH